MILTFVGFVSNAMGGFVIDKFKNNFYWGNPNFIIFSSVFSIPMVYATTMMQDNFLASLMGLAGYTLISSPLAVPSITMMQQSTH